MKPANNEEDRPMQVNVASNSNSQLKKVQRHLPKIAKALNNDVDIIPPYALHNIFRKAGELLNKDGSITKVASSELNKPTVKSSYDPKPHILQPLEKNKFCLKCDYRLFNWYNICQHSLAASVGIGISFEYLTKVRQKVRQGKGSLTGAFNTTRKLSEKVIEKNEVKKAAKK